MHGTDVRPAPALAGGKPIVANIQVSWIDPAKVREVVLVGSKQRVVFDDMKGQTPLSIHESGVTGKGDNAYDMKNGGQLIPAIKRCGMDPLTSQVVHFMECIKEGKPVRTPGQDGVAVIKILEAAERSMANNSVQTVVE